MLVFGKQREKNTTQNHRDGHVRLRRPRFVVEGCLTDHRLKEFRMATGEDRTPGILHQMIVCLLVNKTTLEIEDLQVEMPVIPGSDCLETIHCLDPVKGLKVVGGFTAKVKDIAGGTKGCNTCWPPDRDGTFRHAGIRRLSRPKTRDFLLNNFDLLMTPAGTGGRRAR